MVIRSRRWWPHAALFGFFAWDSGVPLSALSDIGEPRIGIVQDLLQRPQLFEAVGLTASELASLKSLLTFDPAFADVFAVYVVNPDDAKDRSNPPVSGNYVIEGQTLVFVPRHPLKAGVSYRVVLKVRGLSNPQNGQSSDVIIEREFAIPSRELKDIASTNVEQVYPTAEVLPENHLRFYIHFSQPISRGIAYQNLELLDEAGKPVEEAFLEIGEELWDPHGKRFTLLLDPGRVKRGLKPREELGPILQLGKKYTLRIKSGWTDANGQSLAREFRKEFTVGPAVEGAIDLKHWGVELPEALTKRPLTVEFPRSLDHALLERALWVTDAAGERIPGQIHISPAERSWSFTPSDVWHGAIYQLLIDANLEDISGNSLRRAFEVDELKSITQSIERDVIRIPFEISASDHPATAKAGINPCQAQGGETAR